MLILVLIDVQYSQKAIFSFEKGSIGQNHSSGSHHPVKKKKKKTSKMFDSLPHSLPLFGKPCFDIVLIATSIDLWVSRMLFANLINQTRSLFTTSQHLW